jgi:hypothetical protein
LHIISTGCGFNNRAHWCIYIKLPAYALFLDTGRDTRCVGYQRFLRSPQASPVNESGQKEQVLIPSKITLKN